MEVRITGPARDSGATNVFRRLQTALLKIGQQESAVGFKTSGSKLARLFEGQGSLGELAVVEKSLALLNERIGLLRLAT